MGVRYNTLLYIIKEHLFKASKGLSAGLNAKHVPILVAQMKLNCNLFSFGGNRTCRQVQIDVTLGGDMLESQPTGSSLFSLCPCAVLA